MSPSDHPHQPSSQQRSSRHGALRYVAVFCALASSMAHAQTDATSPSADSRAPVSEPLEEELVGEERLEEEPFADVAEEKEIAPPQARLEYELGAGASACPGVEIIRGAVAARLGFSPFSPVATRTLRVRIFAPDDSVTSEGARIVLIAEVLLLEGEELVGERRLESETADCTELSRALELAMAVAVDPMSLTRPPPPRPRPVIPPQCPQLPALPMCIEPDIPDEPTPQPEPPPEAVPPIVLFDFGGTPQGDYPKIFGSIGAMALLQTTGNTPTFAPVLNVGIRVHPNVSVAYEGRAETPSNTLVNGGDVRLQLTTGALVPCYHQGWLSGCALVTGGVTAGHFTPLLFDRGEVGDLFAPYFSVGGRVALEIPLWRFFLRFNLDVNGQIVVLEAVDVASAATYYQQDYLSGGAGIAVGGIFP